MQVGSQQQKSTAFRQTARPSAAFSQEQLALKLLCREAHECTSVRRSTAKLWTMGVFGRTQTNHID